MLTNTDTPQTSPSAIAGRTWKAHRVRRDGYARGSSYGSRSHRQRNRRRHARVPNHRARVDRGAVSSAGRTRACAPGSGVQHHGLLSAMTGPSCASTQVPRVRSIPACASCRPRRPLSEWLPLVTDNVVHFPAESSEYTPEPCGAAIVLEQPSRLGFGRQGLWGARVQDDRSRSGLVVFRQVRPGAVRSIVIFEAEIRALADFAWARPEVGVDG